MYAQPDPTGTLRPLRRPLHARSTHRPARRARPGMDRRQGRPDVHGRARPHAARVRQRAQPALRGAPLLRGGRRPHPAQARGPQPHRRAQDPQRHRPGAARQAHRQAPGHRRDRCRPARCRLGDGVRLPRPGVRRLHGRARHPASGPQRRTHADARRRGRPGHDRQSYVEGRDQRGAARLGRERRHDVVPVRHRGGPAPVPEHGARPDQGHRRRGPRAGARADRLAARRRGGLRRRRVQRDRALHGVHRRCRRQARRHRGRWRRRRDRASRGDDHGRRRRRAARRPVVPAAGRGRPDDRVALDLRRARLSRCRPRALVPRRHRPGVVRAGHRRRGDVGLRPAVQDRGHHPGDRVGARPRRRARAGQGARPRLDDPRQPVGSRRQGRAHRRGVLRPDRRAGRPRAGVEE